MITAPNRSVLSPGEPASTAQARTADDIAYALQRGPLPGGRALEDLMNTVVDRTRITTRPPNAGDPVLPGREHRGHVIQVPLSGNARVTPEQQRTLQALLQRYVDRNYNNPSNGTFNFRVELIGGSRDRLPETLRGRRD